MSELLPIKNGFNEKKKPYCKKNTNHQNYHTSKNFNQSIFQMSPLLRFLTWNYLLKFDGISRVQILAKIRNLMVSVETRTFFFLDGIHLKSDQKIAVSFIGFGIRTWKPVGSGIHRTWGYFGDSSKNPRFQRNHHRFQVLTPNQQVKPPLYIWVSMKLVF